MATEIRELDVVRFLRHEAGTGNTRSRWDEPTPVYPGAMGTVVIDYGDAVCVEVSCVDPYNSVLVDVPKDAAELVWRRGFAGDREGLCQLCGCEYGVWSAPSPVWNPVMRLSDGSDRFPFVCPTCFMREAEGVLEPHTTWSLAPQAFDD